MPPREAKRLLLRMAMVSGAVRETRARETDVRKTLSSPTCRCQMRLVVEWGARRWLYGMRPAASAWEDAYVENLR